jgi:limonene 1,2-monooxygenase
MGPYFPSAPALCQYRQMLRSRLRFGIFAAPFHATDENPSVSLQRDRALIQWLDELGYDEAWVGEHHSAGYEIIASPELFIADVAARTQRIRLGTGVVSLPYHHPLMVADRMLQLDHLTRGRAMFGVGPGLLPSDAMMLGIDPRNQRDMMTESLDAIIRLMRGEIVTKKTSWFELRDAKVQLAPYTRPHMEIAVAASVSPSGPRTAGKWGTGMLSPAATSTGGFSALAHHWGLVEETAREHGTQVSRSNWRVAGPVHIAESREQARKDVKFGLPRFLHYFQKVVALPGIPETGDADYCLDAMVDAGFVVCGEPDDLVKQIARLEEQTGGFGAFLVTTHDWANREATHRSFDLLARYVMPKFQDAGAWTERSMNWVSDNRTPFLAAATQGMLEAIQKDADRERPAPAVKRAERR